MVARSHWVAEYGSGLETEHGGDPLTCKRCHPIEPWEAARTKDALDNRRWDSLFLGTVGSSGVAFFIWAITHISIAIR